MSTNPSVTVLMPVYNAGKFLKPAIESILKQTFTDFEFLIINDGSTDSSRDVIMSFSDKRIRFLENTSNKGLAYTLNRGLQEATGKYIARMDADDISLADRLATQVNFLETHSDHGVVGVLFAVRYLPSNKLEIGGVRLIDDIDLKAALRQSNIFCHGEVMFRTTVIREHNLNYNSEYTPCEDYDFWRRLAPHTKFHTLPQVLYIYTVHASGMTGTQSEKMAAQIKRISEEIKQTIPPIKPSLRFMVRQWQTQKTYTDRDVSILNQKINLYMKLNYQVFLYRLGPAYWPISFFISPKNWFKKLFGFLPEPTKITE